MVLSALLYVIINQANINIFFHNSELCSIFTPNFLMILLRGFENKHSD